MRQQISVKTNKLANSIKNYTLGYCNCGGFPDCICDNRSALQSDLQTLLRDTYNIQMILKPFYDSLKKENTFVCDVIRISDGNVIKSPRMNSYEKALEIGLQNGIKLITN